MTAEELLGQAGFFQGMSGEYRKMLAARSRTQTVAKRGYLFMEGEKGEAVFVLAQGSIQLVKTSPDGKEIVVKIVAPGETFAEVVLFERDAYPVSAVALKKSTVCRIARRDFLACLDRPGFRNDFVGLLCRRLRYLADRILLLTSYDVEQRFFMFLEEHYGRRQDYALTLALKDIAAAVGTTPETLSRLLLRLREEKKAVLKGKQLKLKAGFWETGVTSP